MMLVIFVTAAPAVSFAAKPVCLEGTPRPVDPHFANELRPTRTAQCPYDFDELAARITKLSIDRHALDSVETVEKALSIPQMTTSADDTRFSSYSMSLSGQDGWKLLVWVREAFYPTNKGPARFVPGLRPKRLFSVRDAKLIVSLHLTAKVPGDDSLQCLPMIDMIKLIKSSGWEDVTRLGYATDGAQPSPAFKYADKSVILTGGKCVENIDLVEIPSVQH
jgi:hypothetical protein